MEWFEAVEVLTPHLVRIMTPQGSGTGFLIARAKTNTVIGIATAAHVVDHAHYWEQPLRIRAADSAATLLLRAAERAVLVDQDRDTAAVLFDDKGAFPLPASPVELIEPGKCLKVGNTIGWLGFPAIPAADLCFFTGSISAWIQSHSAYFVDGVAINGVSGGPAFSILGGDPFIIGVVSAYMPNRATGETLPGLGIVRDVFQFHDVISRFRSVDEAKEQETPAGEPPPPQPTPPEQVPSQARRAP